eukprot:351882_1
MDNNTQYKNILKQWQKLLQSQQNESNDLSLQEESISTQMKVKKKYTQLFGHDDMKHQNISFWPNQDNLYCVGYEFYYGYDDEYKPANLSHKYAFDLSQLRKKFSCLRTELTDNTISILSMEQFNAELFKAKLHCSSHYFKQNFDHIQFTVEHILSLIIYCNYTNFQYEFSKTYRIGYGDEEFNFLHLQHLHFY